MNAGKHAIFGRVDSGMQTVQKIGSVQTDDSDRPKEEIRIIKARVL